MKHTPDDPFSTLPDLVLERIALATLPQDRLRSVAALSSVSRRLNSVLAPRPRNPFWPQAYRALRGKAPVGLRSKALFSRLRRESEMVAQRNLRMSCSRARNSICAISNENGVTVYETVQLPNKDAVRLIPLRQVRNNAFHRGWLCARFLNEPSLGAYEWCLSLREPIMPQLDPMQVQLGDLSSALLEPAEFSGCGCGEWLEFCELVIPNSTRLCAMLLPISAAQLPEFCVLEQRAIEQLHVELYFLAYRRQLCNCPPLQCAFMRSLLNGCLQQGISSMAMLRTRCLHTLTWLTKHASPTGTLSFKAWLDGHDVEHRFRRYPPVSPLFSAEDIERIEHCG